MVAVAAAVLDFVTRDATQTAVAADVRKSTHAQGATVGIDSFPFLYDIAASGRLDRVDVTVTGVPVGAVRIDQIRLDARQVRFDRRRLLESHYVDITSVQQATISVVARLSNLQNTVANDLGVQVSGTSSSDVVIAALGHQVATLDLTRIPIIPDCPLTISHRSDTYTFTCTVSPVPQTVLAALSRATSRQKL